MGQAVYAIDAFPDDDLLWRIEWIGGVGYNTSVPSEPQIDVCLAQLPKGEKNPLSARARSSQVEKRTVKIGVGLLPYVWIGSVWQKILLVRLFASRSKTHSKSSLSPILFIFRNRCCFVTPNRRA